MEEQIDQIIAQIYNCVLESGGWERLLMDIAQVIGAVSGFFAGLDIRRGRGGYWHSTGHLPQLQRLYNERYLDLDPTLAHIIKVPGKAVACSEYLSDEMVQASAFYKEFMLPNDYRYVLSGVIDSDGSLISFFGFQRLVSQSPFSAEETSFLQRLIPHFARAEKILSRISKVDDVQRLAMAVLDRLDYGIVIVDPGGRVRMTNLRAEQWLKSGNVISSHFGKIRIANERNNQLFEELVRSTECGDTAEAGGTGARALARMEGSGCTILALPVSGDEGARLGDVQAQFMLVLFKDDQQRVLAGSVLKDLYGLTAAETRIAIGLASGDTLEELSKRLFVSLATIKTHTQHIFQKTGVSRQAELIRLIYGVPALF